MKRSNIIAGWPCPVCAAVAAFGLQPAAMAETAYSAATALEEITVTARKREESLQSAPLAVSAFTSEGLEYRGVSKIDALAKFTPGLVIQNNPGEGGSGAVAAIYIRGIGQSDFIPTVEPGVGLYVDGVYIARSVGAILDLVDVERVEVLRGPQGTLFGRNTIGGAISITTRKPGSEFGGRIEATLGSRERIDVKASVDIPLSSTFALEASAASFDREGYVLHTVDGRRLGDDNTLTGRLAARWRPTEALEINWSLDGTRDRENGAPMVTIGLFAPSDPGYLSTFMALNSVLVTGDPFSCATPAFLSNPACFNGQYVNAATRENRGTARQYSNLDLLGTSLAIDWTTTGLTLRSITAYRDIDSQFARDIDESPVQIGHVWDDLQQHQFSQEFQALGSAFGSRLEWILGAYYLEEKANNVNELEFLVADFISGGRIHNTAWALFGQATWSLTEAIKLTLGMRYTDEKKKFTPDQRITAVNVPAFIFPFPVGTPLLPPDTVPIDISEWTPMANLSWAPTENLLTYVSYSEGFKSGGFTQRIFPPETSVPTFRPEFVKVYEAGFKLTSFDQRLRLNGAVFHTRYDDLQIAITNLTRVGPFISNAAKATVTGFELEVTAAPGAGWLLESSVGYLDPEYKEIDTGATEVSLDSRFARISKWTASAAFSKELELGARGMLVPRVDWSYRSAFYSNALNSPQIRQKGYHVLDANLMWRDGEDRYNVVLGVTNLTDETYMVTGYVQPNFGNYEALYARDREWYLTLRYKF